MNLKKSIKAQDLGSSEAEFSSLKDAEVLQVICQNPTTKDLKINVVITQEHYQELLREKNSPANVAFNEFKKKSVEMQGVMEKVLSIAKTFTEPDKKK